MKDDGDEEMRDAPVCHLKSLPQSTTINSRLHKNKCSGSFMIPVGVPM